VHTTASTCTERWKTLRIVTFGCEMSSRGCFATPARFPETIVARTEGYAYAAKV
jgi:hypothetical protein